MNVLKSTIALLCFVSMLPALSADAQKKLSREEFQARKHSYIIQYAGLNEKESARFIPLYKEMRRKVARLNRIISRNECELNHKEKQYTEEQYKQALDRVNDSRIEKAKTEKEYDEKFRSFLSNEKIYKIHLAEIEFHRKILKDIMH
ncbi:MAG: hypothetical protein ACOYJE_03005 [Bacteroidaceae bacterium]|jgi:hypothetical protein